VEKLFKDINSGMLRRKRGADFDLSDSDDDVKRRRRVKRAEFQRMRKALLADENVGKIAENPKKLAFLRAIEDREDDDANFLDASSNSPPPDHRTQNVPDSQPAAEDRPAPGLKRKRTMVGPEMAANRAPPAARRVERQEKPKTIAEISASISSLIEEPNMMPPPPAAYLSDLSEDENSQHTSGITKRRQQSLIVDRLSIKRADSLNSSVNPGVIGAKLAFHDPSTVSNPGFMIPNLLRRATTQNTGDEHGVTTFAGSERATKGLVGGMIRKASTKKSSIAYFAVEAERQKLTKAVELRKEEERRKVVAGQHGLLSGMRAGSFE